MKCMNFDVFLEKAHFDCKVCAVACAVDCSGFLYCVSFLYRSSFLYCFKSTDRQVTGVWELKYLYSVYRGPGGVGSILPGHPPNTPQAHFKHTSSTPQAHFKHPSSTPQAHFKHTSSLLPPPGHFPHRCRRFFDPSLWFSFSTTFLTLILTDFCSIFHEFSDPLKPQKSAWRLHENTIFTFSTLFFRWRFSTPKMRPKWRTKQSPNDRQSHHFRLLCRSWTVPSASRSDFGRS